MTKLFAHTVFLTLLAVLAAVSCRKQEAQREPILFSCSPVEVTTKAGDTFVSNSLEGLKEGKDFLVYAWNTPGSYLTANPGTPNFFNGFKVTFEDNDNQGSNHIYDTSTLGSALDQYWPQSNVEYDYSFFAYYPYFAGSGIPTPTFPAGKVAQFTDFTSKSSVGEMVDFCVADIANDQVLGSTTSGYSGTVGLTFHHMLTLVQIKFVKSRDVPANKAITILDAKLENINTQGDLSVTYTPPESPGTNIPGTTAFAWSNVDTPASYEITIDGVNPEYNPSTPAVPAVNPVTLDYTQVVSEDDIFLMIPQTIWPAGNANPQRIHFWWSAEGGPTAQETTLLLDESKQAIGSTVPSGITTWGRNKMVTYTVVIRTAPMEFGTDDYLDLTVDIAPWPSEDVNGYYQIID